MSKKINPMINAAILYVAGTIVGQGITFLGTMVFTRLMSKEDYGLYSTYYSIMAVLEVLVGSNFYVALQNAYVDYKFEIEEYKKACLFLTSLICVVISVIVIGIKILFLPHIPFYMTAFALIHAYAFFVINYRIYCDNMEYKYKNKFILLILPTTLQFLLALFMVVQFPGNMLGARVVGSAMGVGICGVIAYVSIIRNHGQIVVFKYWKYGLRISCPSIVMSLSYLIMQQCDKVMITYLCGAEDTAVYSVIYYLGYAIAVVSQGVGTVFQAWVYRAIDDNKLRNIKVVQKWYIVLVLIMEISILMLAPEIVKFIAPEEYWQYEYVAPFILSAVLIVLYELYTMVALFFKKTGKVSMCVLASALINVLMNMVLIPQFGAVAACYTTVFSYIVLFFLTKCVVDKEIKGVYSDKLMYLFILVSIVSCAFFSRTKNNLEIRILIYGSLLLIICIYSRFKWKEIKELIWKGR